MDKKEKLKKLQKDLAKLLGKEGKDPEREIAETAADVVSLPAGIIKKVGSITEMERKLLKLLDKTKKSGGPKKVKDLEYLYKDKIKTPTPKSSDAIKDIQKTISKATKKKMSPEELLDSKRIIKREDFKDNLTNAKQAQAFGKKCSLEDYKFLKTESEQLLKRKNLYKLSKDKEHAEILRKRALLYRETLRAYELAHPRLPKDIKFWRLEK